MKTAKTAAKPAETTAKTADQKEQEFLQKRESELIAKYPHVLPNTVERGNGTHKGKITVEIACQHPGCRNRRRVATSDCWQVSRCSAHVKVKATAAKKKGKGKVASKATSNARPTLKEAVAAVKQLQNWHVHHKTKAAVLADFKKWSGGHTPAESSNEEIQTYLETAIQERHNKPAIRSWLQSENQVKA